MRTHKKAEMIFKWGAAETYIIPQVSVMYVAIYLSHLSYSFKNRIAVSIDC